MQQNRKFRFFFHYNKPASIEAGSNRLSLHYKKSCHIVENIDCRVTIKTKHKKTQPRCVLSGEARNIKIENGTAFIT